MTRLIPLKSVLCLLMVPLLSCNLIDVTGDEDARSGRGAKLHDPYQSLASGSVRLSLQYYNGCAFLANGQMVAKNSTPVPYPATCSTPLFALDPINLKTPPAGELQLMTNTPYFLNQFTVTDTVLGLHTGPEGRTAALNWIRSQSWMKKLDWGNVGASPEQWIFNAGLPGLTKDAWNREVFFENANWEKVEDDTLTIEVLDRDAVSRLSVKYDRKELLLSSSHAAHNRASWRLENIQAPRFPGDPEPPALVTRPTDFPQPPSYRTFARLDLVGNSNPFKTFTTPSDPGEGALKVTWSQMPNDPFYFPVRFVARETLPTTCTDEVGVAKQCAFGMDPRVEVSPPADGSDVYQPGETLTVRVDYRDSEGNRLHPKGEYPSAQAITSDWVNPPIPEEVLPKEKRANGLLALVAGHFLSTLEADNTAALSVAGPLQEMRVPSNPLEPRPYFVNFPYVLEPATTLRLIPSAFSATWPTEFKITLPPDAKAGTYVVFSKASRYFLGERMTKMKPYFIQVKEPVETTYPGRVGNCQICHRGTLSLDNLRHGLAVDHVEGCKACHFQESDGAARPQEFIHQIHMNSPRYPQAKNECRICHMTKESATRPSINTCGACHPTVHGDKYFKTTFTTYGEPNRFGNCAQSCHAGDQTPKAHILPEN